MYGAFFFATKQGKTLSWELLNFFCSKYLSFYLCFYFSFCATRCRKICSKLIPFTFTYTDKSGKPKLVVIHFTCPTCIKEQTITCTVISYPGSLENHRSVGRQTVKHAMFVMICVVQSYEIDCIYNAHQCGVIWGSICWI